MTAYIRITRRPYQEPLYLKLVLEASNDSQKLTLEYDCAAGDLKEIAQHLENFPRHAKDIYHYELGSEEREDRLAFYLSFKAMTINAKGACALHLRINNNAEPPKRAISEFSILAEPAQINRLGELFGTFSELKEKVLRWKVE